MPNKLFHNEKKANLTLAATQTQKNMTFLAN